MIKFLANLFRGLSFIFGVTAPEPGEDERSFVFMWLGILVFVVAFCALLFYLISRLHFS
jgi:nucleoside permease NupC